MPFVEVSALRKAYGSSVAVEGVSFSVPQGACYGLLGPNGAGKTTTISIMAGTMNADAGEVRLDGQKVGVDRLSVKRRIGYVPQELALYEDLSALDNLRFFGSLYGLSGPDLKASIDAALDLAGLRERSRETVRSYSGGMKRRLNISAALLHDPDLLILDEPTVGVDPQSRNLIFEGLIALIKRGKTLIYTTHYMEEVERLCDRVAIIDHGRVVADGTLADLHRLVPSRTIVHIDLLQPLTKPVPDLPGVAMVGQERDTLIFELSDLTRDLPSALQAVGGSGGVIGDVRTPKPTLEEAFLQLTGRKLRD